MSDPRISIRDSPIHGRGVFAREAIAAGTVLVEYQGEWISRREAERREAANAEGGITYILEYDDDTFIDGSVGGNEARLINHSCTPNCAIRRESGRAIIYAKKTIPAGQELSFDYAFSEGDERIPCRCGSPECRGVLNEGTSLDPAWRGA